MTPSTLIVQRSLFLTLFCLSLIGLSQTLEKEHIKQLEFRHVGPVGNRIVAGVGIPGNDLIYYVGAASGGI